MASTWGSQGPQEADPVTVTTRLIELHSPDEWAEALSGIPHGPAHTWAYNRAIQRSSGNPTYLYVLEGASTRIACPFAERDFSTYTDAVTPYGFSGFTGIAGDCSLEPHWWSFASSRGWICAYIALHPSLEDRSWFRAEALPQKTLFTLDLTLPEADLVARLSTNRKRQIRQRFGISRQPDTLTDFFVREYGDFMRRKRAAPVFRFSKETLEQLCRMPNTILIGAVRAGTVRAVSLFAYTPYLADFLFHISLAGEERYSAGLLWRAAMELKALSVPRLNLGGGVREEDSLAEYKRRFGGDQVTFRALKEVYCPEIYRALCAESGVKDEAGRAYFPAYRAASRAKAAS